MKTITLLPADTYTVYNQTILTDLDRKVLINLYEPIIGMQAISLFFTLWSDLDKAELSSNTLTHHHLMTILKANLETIKEARKCLEAVGLLKSYLKISENINEYIYELYSPMSPKEFFSHPILNVILYNNIGIKEYERLNEYYKKNSIDYNNFVEITATMNQTFASIDSLEIKETRGVKEIGVNLDNKIDFDLIITSLPSNMLSVRALNKRVKELINSLAFVYNLDTLKMMEILRTVVDDNGMINKQKLIDATRKYYEFNHNGNLPTLIYRTQPEYLKNPDGETNDRARMIHIMENYSPYDFLRKKYRGATPTNRDVRLLEYLAVDLKLKPGVINVLIDYILRVHDNKLNRSFVETIAGQWARMGFVTVEDAMKFAEKEYKKNNKNKENSKKQNNIPIWFNERSEKVEVSEEEKKELESLLEEFR